MVPSVHLIVSIILAIILFPSYGFKAILVFITSFLIDIDHLFYYYSKFKRFSLIETYNYCSDNNYKKHIGALFLFHSIELLVLLIILSFYSEIALILAIGLISHYVLDFIDDVRRAGHLIKAWSFLRLIFPPHRRGKISP